MIVVVLAPSVAMAGAFQFRVPDGWTNLSPDAPPSELVKAPPQLLEQVRSAGFVFYAADLAHADDGFMENVNVTVGPGGERVTPAVLDDVASRMDAEVKKQGDASYRVIEKGVVTIGAATAGRFVGELGLQAMTVKQIVYLIPGASSQAVVTYSTTPAEFARYQPIFDAAAQATVGAADPPSTLQRYASRAGRGALVGGILGGLAALVAGLARRKKT
jgi:hypothetical protein